MTTASAATARSTVQVLVGGTAGGVGTTTIAALLFSSLSHRRDVGPRLLDHTAGTLGRRLPEGDEVTRVDEDLLLHDLGPHALVGAARLAEPTTMLTAVTAATPNGCALAGELLAGIDERYGRSGLARTTVALVGVFGRHRLPEVAALTATPYVRGVVVFPPDPALAAGGRIPLARLSRPSLASLDALKASLLARPT